MKRFIPAWYSHDKWWESTSVPFYQKRQYTDFDDMISLMTMHSKNNVDYQLMILSFSPYLRTFLHRYDLFETNYWSVFDDIQGVSHQTPQAIDYRDLAWPENTEFIFTPYQIQAVTGEHTFSKIHFSQEGYLMWIEDFQHNIIQRRYVIDDRGFISAVRTYTETGQSKMKHYFSIKEEEIFKEDLRNKTVTIKEQFQSNFKQTTYATMADLIEEKFKEYAEREIKKDDLIIVASDERHNSVMAHTIDESSLCFSVFTERNKKVTPELFDSISQARYCLVDTQDNQREIQRYAKESQTHLHLLRVTPFDAQTISNKSSQLYDTYVGLWIDQLPKHELRVILTSLFQYIQQKDHFKLKLLTKYKNDPNDWLMEEIARLNDTYHQEKQEHSDEIEDILASQIKKETVIELEYVPFSEDFVRAVSNLRLVVDLSNEPDLFLQICCIGAGVPQVNYRGTDYVKHEQNGLIIKDISQIVSALDYFLVHLKKWNYSYAYSMRLVDEFSSINIIHQINQLFEGDDKYATYI